MQGMQRRKGNIGTHCVWVFDVGNVKDTDLGDLPGWICKIKETRLSGIIALGKGTGLLNSPL